MSVFKVSKESEEGKELAKNLSSLILLTEKWDVTRFIDRPKMNRAHGVKGRTRWFVCRGLPPDARQNYAVKFKVPICVDGSLTGARNEDGCWVTDYPYGDVYILY